MINKFKFYIINLKQSNERKKNIINELNKQNITNFQIIDAIDGNKLSEEELETFTFGNKKNFNTWGPKLTPSQIGCALSHIKIYKKFLKSNYEFAFILEDDAIFLRKFDTELKNFIIKNLKYKKQIMLLSELKEFLTKPLDNNQNYEIVNVTNAFYTHSYLINKEAAKSIINFNYPLKTVADNFVFFKIYCGIKLTGLNPYILDQDKKKFKTTIEMQQDYEKNFLFKRSIYKIKNKILKRFINFSGHKN